MKTIDLGNNEAVTMGVVQDGDDYLALTMTASKVFKTQRGAERWLARRGYLPNGERIPEEQSQ